MTKTQSHAQRELEILAKTTPDAIITPDAKQLIEVFEYYNLK